ncbi:MAG: hypothetical protein ACE5EW_00845 [Thermoplasmata archaeon]
MGVVDEARRRLSTRIAVGSLLTALILIVPTLLIVVSGVSNPDFPWWISIIIAAPILVMGLTLAARIRWG